MFQTKMEQEWESLAGEVITGMAEWRMQHPRATFREIEVALDERLDRMRARMLADAAMASPQTDWRERGAEERSKCPECQTPLLARSLQQRSLQQRSLQQRSLQQRSLQQRSLQSQGSAEIVLERSQGTCPECGTSLFPPG